MVKRRAGKLHRRISIVPAGIIAVDMTNDILQRCSDFPGQFPASDIAMSSQQPIAIR